MKALLSCVVLGIALLAYLSIRSPSIEAVAKAGAPADPEERVDPEVELAPIDLDRVPEQVTTPVERESAIDEERHGAPTRPLHFVALTPGGSPPIDSVLVILERFYAYDELPPEVESTKTLGVWVEIDRAFVGTGGNLELEAPLELGNYALRVRVQSDCAGLREPKGLWTLEQKMPFVLELEAMHSVVFELEPPNREASTTSLLEDCRLAIYLGTKRAQGRDPDQLLEIDRDLRTGPVPLPPSAKQLEVRLIGGRGEYMVSPLFFPKLEGGTRHLRVPIVTREERRFQLAQPYVGD